MWSVATILNSITIDNFLRMTFMSFQAFETTRTVVDCQVFLPSLQYVFVTSIFAVKLIGYNAILL